MKAAIVSPPNSLPTFADFAEPVAADGEVVVHVIASALSQLAKGRAAGTHYSANGQHPFVVGVDGVGRLDDGRRVYFLLPRAPYGAMAERTVVPDGHWLALPDNIDDADAAVIANPGMSSWAALTERAALRDGETVLINGATGAAGALAVRIARHLGAARVIATGRNEAALRNLGADAVVPLLQDNAALEAELRGHFADGIDIVLDYLWGASARAMLVAAAKAAPEGLPIRFVQIGAASGTESSIPAAVLRSSAIELKGSGLGSVGLPQLMAAIGGVFRAAAQADLALEYRTVPVARVTETWRDEGRRLVYLVN